MDFNASESGSNRKAKLVSLPDRMLPSERSKPMSVPTHLQVFEGGPSDTPRV